MASIFGLDFAPVFVPLSRRLETMAVLHYIYFFIFIPVICVGLLVYALFTKYWWLALIYGVWFLYDLPTPRRGSRPKAWFRHWRFWKWLRDYFPVSLVKTAELDPSRNYVMGYHPHGVFSVGCFANFATEATNFSALFPGITTHPCTLTGQFWFPFRREYISLTGAIEVSKESIRYVLTQPKKGKAVVIVVGGAVETLDAKPGCYKLVLHNRKGFIKMALQYGADLVPTYSFGENDLYAQIENPPGSILRAIQQTLKKMLGFPPPLFRGRGIFNYSFGILPYRLPVTTVVGSSIRVEQCSSPSQEQIDQLHSRYEEELYNLFEAHKLQYGVPKDEHLQFI